MRVPVIGAQRVLPSVERGRWQEGLLATGAIFTNDYMRAF